LGIPKPYGGPKTQGQKREEVVLILEDKRGAYLIIVSKKEEKNRKKPLSFSFPSLLFPSSPHHTYKTLQIFVK
jgi:hypothetical protein